MPKSSQSIITLPAAISIGVGGMIGAGIFSILGLVAEASGAAMWISFLIGGIIALFSTYSYAKLGAKFPSAGGAVEFLVRGFGLGPISSSINLFMWLAYIISIALYAQGFAAYFMTFFTTTPAPLLEKGVACGIVILFTALNCLGASTVGKAEIVIVLIKVSILILFALIGLFFIHPEQLSPRYYSTIEHILFGTGVLFIGYEGFGLITNAAANMVNPEKNLPRALYISVLLVIGIYLAISITLVGNLSLQEINAASDYALAQAAKPFLGLFGFQLIAIAALFSTASAINATLFGAANVSYLIARDGELPATFYRREWKNATGGLLITTAITVIFILFFDLAGIAMMGSSAFLLIYAAVNAGHLRILKKTQAKKSIVLLSLFLCLALFLTLEIYTYQQQPHAVYTMFGLLLACFIIEQLYRNEKKPLAILPGKRRLRKNH